MVQKSFTDIVEQHSFLDDGKRLYRWCCRLVGRSVGLQKILKNKKDEVSRVI